MRVVLTSIVHRCFIPIHEIRTFGCRDVPTLPAGLTRLYETLLTQQGITMGHRLHYRKWLRYYWDFCPKYGLEPRRRRAFHCLARSCGLSISLTSNVIRRVMRSLFTISES